MKKKITFFFVLLLTTTLYAQHQDNIQKKLDKLSTTLNALNNKVQVDVSGLKLSDLITSIAKENKLNISVDSDINQIVMGSFYNVSVKDLLLFLIHKYKLEIEIINNIIFIKKPKKKKQTASPPPKIDIHYDKNKDLLSINLKNDSLESVAKTLTDKTGKNIVLAPDVKKKEVSAYIVNKPFIQVLKMMAKSNALKITETSEGFYYIEIDKGEKKKKYSKNTIQSSKRKKNTSFEITITPDGALNVIANDASMYDIIKKAAELSHINYYFIKEPTDIKITLFAKEITLKDLLTNIFKGKEYSFNISNGIYIIGKDNDEGIRTTKLIQLENRTIEDVLKSIPKNISSGIEIKEFPELNGLIVTGAESKIKELRDFIFQIDKVVPLIQIEVLIVQYKKSYDFETGLKAGLKNDNSATSGVIFPNANINSSGNSINSLIDAFNGLGIINIGKVTNKFYLNLKFLENNSIIELKSTPKIATLSGHKASVSIGQTDYYYEQSNTLINNGINNNILQSGQWKATQANLSVNITPFVSKDEYVTLEISVEKSSFLGRAGENAPPGKTSQTFNALVRVKNNEMILLGGLDEFEKSNSGTGTPFLSRIPIIKWFFSGRKKKKSKSKLHVFIKPTVIY